MAINNLYISYLGFFVNNNWGGDYVLLTNENYNQIINSIKSIDCIMEFLEIDEIVVAAACMNATEIEILDIDISIYKNDNLYLYFWLFKQLIIPENKKKLLSPIDTVVDLIYNNTKNIQPVIDREQTPQVMWTAGCSYTYGTGIKTDERYGSLLSQKLNLPEVQLAKPGASIFFAADSILQADIKKDDIVVWGLTNFSRTDYFDDQFEHVSLTSSEYLSVPKKFQNQTIDYFSSNTVVGMSMKYIHQVNNFCSKVGAKLYIINLLDTYSPAILTNKYKNYLDLSSNSYNNKLKNFDYVDLGTDGVHPGPKQHQVYAEKIYQFIKENNHG